MPYQRWVDDKQKQESVMVLREWVLRETEFLTITAETKRGLSASANTANMGRTMFSLVDNKSNGYNGPGKEAQFPMFQSGCPVCGQNHAIWKCTEFLEMNVKDRWKIVKQNRLCYDCLGRNHAAWSCRRHMFCGIAGCTKSHNRLLHVYQQESLHGANSLSHGSCKSKGVLTALRTIPVVLKHGMKRIQVNAVLDDASTRTYINSDIAAELGVSGNAEKLRVNVLNGEVREMDTMHVKVGLESIDGNIDIQVSAFTADEVTGSLEVIDWRHHAREWNHLKCINFPSTGSVKGIGMLIGLDQADLHISYKDIGSNRRGDPIARLTPLGWTCIYVPSINGKQAASQVVASHVAYNVRVNG